MECILCGHQAYREQVINVKSIIALWNKLGISTSRLFKDDVISIFKCGNCGIRFYSPACSGDDQFYGDLAAWDWYYKHSGKSEYKLSSALISSGDKVLDVGCGIGEFASYLPPGAEFLGFELSSTSVEIAQSLGRNVEKIDINLAPQYLLNNFDCVTCFQVLEHVEDIQVFFESLVSLCKPGGLIVIAVPNNDGFIGSAVNNILNMPPHHVLLWNRQSLEYLAMIFNLEVIKFVEEPLADIHRHWAYTVFLNKIVKKTIGTTPKTIDLSLVGKIVNKISALLAYPLYKINPNIISSGHSAIIVLRKRIDE